ncbi:hypothetical protein CB1_000258003 [Camelus ferus]|nr:hypothetical protein CB1_000258003 [Camelus ferus]
MYRCRFGPSHPVFQSLRHSQQQLPRPLKKLPSQEVCPQQRAVLTSLAPQSPSSRSSCSGPHASASDGPMAERGELDLTGAKQNTGVWLVKVPKYLSQQWAKAPGRGEVGKLRIAKPEARKKSMVWMFVPADPELWGKGIGRSRGEGENMQLGMQLFANVVLFIPEKSKSQVMNEVEKF